MSFRTPYPGYDVLAKWDSPSFDETTRAVLRRRLEEVPPRRFLGQELADPAGDRIVEVTPGQAHEIVHGFGDGRGMADRGQEIGDLLVAGIFAFDEDAVEIEDQRIEPHARAPNKAVPTRTWVAPSITAVS